MKKTLAALLASSTLALTTLPAHAVPITQNLTFSNLEARTGVLNSTGFASGFAAGTANYLGFDRNLGQLDSVKLRLRGIHSVSSYLSYPFNNIGQNPVQSVTGILNLVAGNNVL